MLADDMLADVAAVCQGLHLQLTLLQEMDSFSIFTRRYALAWCWPLLFWRWRDRALHEARIENVVQAAVHCGLIETEIRKNHFNNNQNFYRVTSLCREDAGLTYKQLRLYEFD